MRNLLLVAIAVILLVSCDKTVNRSAADECESLKQGLISNNETLVKTSLEEIIANLPSTKYTEDNLTALVGSVQSNCSITATFDCFNCIKTLPPMTEIYLTVGNSATRIVDLSYDDANMIVVKNLH
jgi:hypothetical protein